MDIRNISFCDKTAYNITNDDYKKLIVDILKNKHINILEKYNYYSENKHKNELLENEYIFSYKTKGNNYLLLLTKINNKKLCFFIDRKINKGYIYPRILLVHYRFKEEIYNDTILNGELVLTNNKWNFYINNIYYYCGFNLYKYNIYDKLNNIKKLLSNCYISDNNIEPCELKIKRYYPLNKINIKKNKDNIIGIEFIHYNGNKSIFFTFLQKQKHIRNNGKINTNINLNKNKIFKISKSNNIDIYNLYCMKKNNLYKIGIARIDSSNSNYLYNHFKDKSINYKSTICCKYNNNFKKWTPIEFVDKKVDDYFDIKEFLNKI